MLQKIRNFLRQSSSKPTEVVCPVCGFYCSGNGGYGCIDKPSAPGDNELPNGLTLLQKHPDCAVDLESERFYGWLFTKGPNGQWVTSRKLTELEIMQAEDQRDQGIVQHGTKYRFGG